MERLGTRTDFKSGITDFTPPMEQQEQNFTSFLSQLQTNRDGSSPKLLLKRAVSSYKGPWFGPRSRLLAPPLMPLENGKKPTMRE